MRGLTAILALLIIIVVSLLMISSITIFTQLQLKKVSTQSSIGSYKETLMKYWIVDYYYNFPYLILDIYSNVDSDFLPLFIEIYENNSKIFSGIVKLNKKIVSGENQLTLTLSDLIFNTLCPNICECNISSYVNKTYNFFIYNILNKKEKVTLSVYLTRDLFYLANITIINNNSFSLSNFQFKLDLSFLSNKLNKFNYNFKLISCKKNKEYKYCFDNNVLCNKNPSNVIWIKYDDSLNSNVRDNILIVPAQSNMAKDGKDIFIAYTDFSNGIDSTLFYYYGDYIIQNGITVGINNESEMNLFGSNYNEYYPYIVSDDKYFYIAFEYYNNSYIGLAKLYKNNLSIASYRIYYNSYFAALQWIQLGIDDNYLYLIAPYYLGSKYEIVFAKFYKSNLTLISSKYLYDNSYSLSFRGKVMLITNDSVYLIAEKYYDIVFIKLDKEGNIIWYKAYKYSSYLYPTSLLYYNGSFYAAFSGGVIAKLDENGNLIKAIKLSNVVSNTIYNPHLYIYDNKLYLISYHYYSNYYIYLLVFDLNLNLIFSKAYVGGIIRYKPAILVCNNFTLFTFYYGGDIFLATFNNSLSPIWVKNLSTPNIDIPTMIYTEDCKNIYVVGHTYKNNNYDIFILKTILNFIPNGNYNGWVVSDFNLQTATPLSVSSTYFIPDTASLYTSSISLTEFNTNINKYPQFSINYLLLIPKIQNSSYIYETSGGSINQFFNGWKYIIITQNIRAFRIRTNTSVQIIIS